MSSRGSEPVRCTTGTAAIPATRDANAATDLAARVLTGTAAQTAPVFLTGFVTSQGLFLAQVCAASLVVSLPVLAAGFAARDKLMQGLSLGAVR